MLPLNFLEGASQDGESWSKSGAEKTLMTRSFFDKADFLFQLTIIFPKAEVNSGRYLPYCFADR